MHFTAEFHCQTTLLVTTLELLFSRQRRKHSSNEGKSIKFRLITSRQGPKREQMYSCTLSLTSALDPVRCNATTRMHYPRDRDRVHRCRRLLGPRVGREGCGKSPPSTPTPPTTGVTISTTLSRSDTASVNRNT